jgi:hypothetical protein
VRHLLGLRKESKGDVMMVMPANHSSPVVHWIAGAYPGKIGWLVGPSARTKTKFQNWMPFALDNDAFSAWTKQEPWSESLWMDLLNWVRLMRMKPLWAIVPDSVGNREETLDLWERYSSVVKTFGWATAFAVQDGMVESDVPSDADVVFVGGTTEWKWRTAKMWCSRFPRVHVGRVNSIERLWKCEDWGAESVDGTGWFRDPSDPSKVNSLLEWITGSRRIETREMFAEL